MPFGAGGNQLHNTPALFAWLAEAVKFKASNLNAGEFLGAADLWGRERTRRMAWRL